MRLQAARALALSQGSVVLARHAEGLLSGIDPDSLIRPVAVVGGWPLAGRLNNAAEAVGQNSAARTFAPFKP